MPTNEGQISGVKISSFPNESIESADLVTGLKHVNGSPVNSNFTFATILTWIRQRISEFYIPLSARGQANGVASLNELGKVPVGQIPSSNATPEMDGAGSAGSALAYARSDHQHPSDTSKISTSVIGAANGVASLGSDGKVPSAQLPTIPSASSATPQNLGTAAAGSSTDYSRADHVHNKPSAADVGAQPAITANGILKGDGAGGVTAATPGTDYQAPLTAGTDYATPTQIADKAAKADLTSIQATGTTNTTGAVIPAGAYFYLNGVYHRVKTQIDVNATFTPGTNCEQTTVGEEIQKKAIFSSTSSSPAVLSFGPNTRAIIFATSTNAGGRGIFSTSTNSSSTASVSALVPGNAITMTSSGSTITVSSTTNVLYEILMLAGSLPTIS